MKKRRKRGKWKRGRAIYLKNHLKISNFGLYDNIYMIEKGKFFPAGLYPQFFIIIAVSKIFLRWNYFSKFFCGFYGNSLFSKKIIFLKKSFSYLKKAGKKISIFSKKPYEQTPFFLLCRMIRFFRSICLFSKFSPFFFFNFEQWLSLPSKKKKQKPKKKKSQKFSRISNLGKNQKKKRKEKRSKKPPNFCFLFFAFCFL